MNRYRQIVESMKKEFYEDLKEGKETYLRAVIRQIDYEFRNYSSDNSEINLSEFADKLINRLKVPASIRASVTDELERIQLQIADVWNEYFEEEAKLHLNDLEVTKILASYEINFGSIDIAETVTTEAKRAVNKGTGYNDLRAVLLKRDLGFSEVNTLANTAMAQFDNAVHVENARQAGVIYYLYDGVVHPNSRIFCRERKGRVYTLGELSSMDNGQGLPVVTALGGYNCTDYLTALINYVRKEFGEKFTESHFRNAA